VKAQRIRGENEIPFVYRHKVWKITKLESKRLLKSDFVELNKSKVAQRKLNGLELA
jgi:hypothetical protein